MEACTITASDVITAFAVPNPNCSSQSQSVFSGLAAQQVPLLSQSPNLLWVGQVLFEPPFRSSTSGKVICLWILVNAAVVCKRRFMAPVFTCS
jgi:hypothetical protein